VTVSKGGIPHVCREFCQNAVRWINTHRQFVRPPSEPFLLRRFKYHGVCPLEGREALLEADSRLLTPHRDGKVDMEEFWSLMHHMTVVLAGDSLMGQVFDGIHMASVMANASGVQFSKSFFDHTNDSDVRFGGRSCDPFVVNNTCTKLQKLHVAKWNATVWVLLYYGLEYPVSDGATMTQVIGGKFGKNFMPASILVEMLKSSDALWMNFGIHSSSESEVTSGLNYLNTLNKLYPGKLYYRMTFPQHYVTNNQSGLYEDRNITATGCTNNTVPSHWTNVLAEKHLINITTVDVHRLFQSRGAYHSQRGGDCSHFCFDVELFYPLWISMALAMQ
jgi:hypothetical protein